jgi:competence protein ComGC
MKYWRQQKSVRKIEAFGTSELLIVLVCIGIILALLPFLAGNLKRRASVQCVSNVKMAAVAFRMWADDHGERFPWEVSTNDGGSREFIGTGKPFLHFQTASNELNSPKVLVCPQDTSKLPLPFRQGQTEPPFNFLSNSNVSYFVGVNAQMNEPKRLLAGDRHISTNGTLSSGLLQIPTADDLEWAPALHRGGNLATANGSAYQVAGNSTNFSMWFVFPALLEIP